MSESIQLALLNSLNDILLLLFSDTVLRVMIHFLSILRPLISQLPQLSGSESNQPGPDDGAVLPPPDVVKPPKVYGVVEPIIDDDDEELEVGPPPQAKEVYLEDLQNVYCRNDCPSLLRFILAYHL